MPNVPPVIFSSLRITEEDQHVEAERGEREVVVLDAQRREAERQSDREAGHRRDQQHERETASRPSARCAAMYAPMPKNAAWPSDIWPA